MRRGGWPWEIVASLRRGREQWTSDERILGRSAFIADLIPSVSPPEHSPPPANAATLLPALRERVATRCGLPPAALHGRSLHRDHVTARAILSYLTVHGYGLPLTTVARHLGVSKQSVLRGVTSGGRILQARGWTDLMPG